MTLKYVEPPANISECVQCPYCSCMYEVKEGDEPRQNCKRCGSSMHIEEMGEFADIKAKESAAALGMDVVANISRAVRSLVNLGFSEDEARDLIAQHDSEKEPVAKRAKKAT